MEGIPRFINTSTGKIVICGPLESLEDLSISDLQSPFHRQCESGYPIHNFSKPSDSTITRQFNVKNK